MTISETGSVQGWAEWVEGIEGYRVGARAWAASGTTHSRVNYAWTTQHEKGTMEGDASTQEISYSDSNME